MKAQTLRAIKAKVKDGGSIDGGDAAQMSEGYGRNGGRGAGSGKNKRQRQKQRINICVC